jgi:signal transduction histidine kinase
MTNCRQISSGNTTDAIAIAVDLKQNLEKINHHGKRADSIVKGVLQHSRRGSQQKEVTDLTTLADENLRLAFHVFKAKEKSFNASIHTEFDQSIPLVDIIPQDLGRVMMRLLTNAFYAVSQRKQAQPEGNDPTLTVSTKKLGNKILISVIDNGNGIPEAVIEKIFQPFFTTKPTGQETGLGLSLSYDIVTKGHSGELKMETKEGEGTRFLITLNMNQAA